MGFSITYYQIQLSFNIDIPPACFPSITYLPTKSLYVLQASRPEDGFYLALPVGVVGSVVDSVIN